MIELKQRPLMVAVIWQILPSLLVHLPHPGDTDSEWNERSDEARWVNQLLPLLIVEFWHGKEPLQFLGLLLKEAKQSPLGEDIQQLSMKEIKVLQCLVPLPQLQAIEENGIVKNAVRWRHNVRPETCVHLVARPTGG